MMNRRRLVQAGWAAASLGAAAAGLWWQACRSGDHVTEANIPPGILAFWQARFDTPGGAALAMADFRGQPLLLNFWGSWCPPCVAEMPEIDSFAQEARADGWQVLGLAVDNAPAVRQFLARQPVSYAIALAGFQGAELSRQLGNTQGSLPYTVAFDRAGQVFQQKLGPTHLAELRAWAKQVKT